MHVFILLFHSLHSMALLPGLIHLRGDITPGESCVKNICSCCRRTLLRHL